MAQSITVGNTRIQVKSIILDLLALALIYFIPAISHLIGFPLYLIEPMRIMLILAIAHTSQRNAYLLALTLPLFSFVISAHPSFLKMLLITAELVLNVWLFYFILKIARNHFAAMFSSIIISKVIYYGVKLLLISFVLISGGLVSTPLYFQLITSLVFSGYVFLIFRYRGLLSKN
jgi:hypothetical protein